MGSFTWPGNVRELENFVVRSLALGSGPVLQNEDSGQIPEKISMCRSAADTQSLPVLERGAILRALEAAKGDRIAAARVLGIGKTTLYRKLKEYRQDPE